MNFAQRLKALMDETETSNYRLAKEIGCHQTTIANILSGKNPQDRTKKAIANFFSVSVAYLDGITEDRSPEKSSHWADLHYGNNTDRQEFEIGPDGLPLYLGKKETPTPQMESERIPNYDKLSDTNRAIVDSMIAQLLAAQLNDQ